MYGKGLVSNATLNHHKQMAQGKIDAGSADSFKSGNQTRAATTSHGELGDAQRGIGGAAGTHAQQPAPDHGDRGRDHYRRGGLI